MEGCLCGQFHLIHFFISFIHSDTFIHSGINTSYFNAIIDLISKVDYDVLFSFAVSVVMLLIIVI